METKYTYKLQGNGKDSWTCEVTDNGVVVDRYMVYEDPTKPKKTDISNINIDSLTKSQIDKLKVRLGL